MKNNLSIGTKLLNTLILFLYLAYGIYIFILPPIKYNISSIQNYTQLFYKNIGITLPNWYYKTGFVLETTIGLVIILGTVLIYKKSKIGQVLILIGSVWNILSINIDLLTCAITEQSIGRIFIMDYFMVVIFWLFIVWFFSKKSVKNQFLT